MFLRRPKTANAAPAPEMGLAGIIPGVIAPSELEHPMLRGGLGLWRELRGERPFPSRSQISPRALGGLLRHTILIKVLAGADEFEVRIIGDAILAVQPDPFQGLTTAEIDRLVPGYGAGLHRMYSHACAVLIPLAFRGPVRREADDHVFHREHLLLPLGEGEAVDHLVSLIIYTQPSA